LSYLSSLADGRKIAKLMTCKYFHFICVCFFSEVMQKQKWNTWLRDVKESSSSGTFLVAEGT
jgi:hypothetical protein